MTDEKLSERAKTIVELNQGYEAWIKAFREGAQGNLISYNFARDTRHLYEDLKWVPLYLVESLEAELGEWKNMSRLQGIGIQKLESRLSKARALATKMLNDGDNYVEDYGRQLNKILIMDGE